MTSIQNPIYLTHRIDSMEYGDGSLWALADDLFSSDSMVFEMTTGGAVASSFTLPLPFWSGLAYADSMIWIAGRPAGVSTIHLAKFDPADGSPEGTVPVPGVTGTVDLFCEGGGYFWMLINGEMGARQIDSTGNPVNFFPLDQYGQGITWDGTYHWMSMAPSRIDAYDFP